MSSWYPVFQVLLTLVVGLVVGSFLNVLIYRVPRGLSILWPPSHCPVCKHRLSWKDNIPLFSYLLLRGRCRYCGAPISLQYPLVEAANAALYLLFLWRFGFQGSLIFFWVMASGALALSVIDLQHHRLPDPLTIGMGAVGLVYHGIHHHLGYALAGMGIGLALGAMIYFLATRIYGPNAFGLGDVKYLGTLGAWGGPFAVPVMLFLASLLGTLVGLVLVWRRRSLRVGVPFGPFLSLALVLTTLFGQRIM